MNVALVHIGVPGTHIHRGGAGRFVEVERASPPLGSGRPLWSGRYSLVS